MLPNRRITTKNKLKIEPKKFLDLLSRVFSSCILSPSLLYIFQIQKSTGRTTLEREQLRLIQISYTRTRLVKWKLLIAWNILPLGVVFFLACCFLGIPFLHKPTNHHSRKSLKELRDAKLRSGRVSNMISYSFVQVGFINIFTFYVVEEKITTIVSHLSSTVASFFVDKFLLKQKGETYKILWQAPWTNSISDLKYYQPSTFFFSNDDCFPAGLWVPRLFHRITLPTKA